MEIENNKDETELSNDLPPDPIFQNNTWTITEAYEQTSRTCTTSFEVMQQVKSSCGHEPRLSPATPSKSHQNSPLQQVVVRGKLVIKHNSCQQYRQVSRMYEYIQ
jgi:hypothetical protein